MSLGYTDDYLECQSADASNNCFSPMMENTSHEIYAFDCQTLEIVHFNQGAINNLGYSAEEMSALSILDIKRDHTLASYLNLVDPLCSGANQSMVFDAIHHRKDGSTYAVEVQLLLMPENPHLFLSIILDTREQKQQADLLRESENRFRTAFETSSDCVLILGQQGSHLFANQAAMDYVGTTAEQAVGKNIQERLSHIPEFMNLWKGRIEQVFSTGKSLRVQDDAVLDGRQVYSDSILAPICSGDGQVTSVYLVLRDMTELKETERKLGDSHEIINRSPAVAFLWSNTRGWPVVFVSDNVLNVLGYSSDDFFSGKVAYSELVHEEDLERVINEMVKYSEDDECEGFTHDPYRLITKAGQSVWVEDRTTFRRNSEGLLTHYQGIVLDITEKIDADMERIRLEKSLYQSDKMASIGQLAAGVAHEVNNPIGFISSNLKTMADYIQELKGHFLAHNPESFNPEVAALFEDFEEAVSESLDGAQRVKRIVADMMGVSRPGIDKMEQTDLHDGIDSTLNIVWNQIKDTCRVEKEYGDIPQLECFQNKINQVFLNLLVNAGHATEHKSGLIRIKTWADLEQIHVSIRDNGSGIPQEHLSRLFDTFFTTKEVGRGTGLGLSLSRDIVHEHGGSITVTSEVGQGTEFVVSLPLVPVASQESIPVV